MLKQKKVYVAGHRGMVGSAIVRALQREGFENIITRTSSEVDLTQQKPVGEFFEKEKPEIVVLAAARVGGILANDSYPYTFIRDNISIQDNVINSAFQNEVEKLIFLGSSCIYPKFAEQPIREDSLLTGELEPTNQWYAIAKISGLKMCEALRKQYAKNYFSYMPTNLYGPNDNFDLETSHVLPALIRKFHEAKKDNSPVTLWGSGTPKREFLYVDDLAEAVLHGIKKDLSQSLYNIGTGRDLSIRELAELIQKIVGHKGEIQWDSSKPDGTPRKLLDIDRIKNEGWKPEFGLEEGIKKTYNWFLENQDQVKEVKL